MWNDILIIEKIDMTQRVNVLLYYLRFIPWLGKKVPQHWFASIKLKQVLAVLMFLISIIGGLFTKILYILVMVVIPADLLSKDSGGLLFCTVFIYLILSGFCGPLSYDNTTKPTKKDYVMIQLMHMEAKRYVKVNWIIHTILQQTILLVILLFLFHNYDAPLWHAFAIVFISSIMRFCGNIYHLAMAQKRGKPFGGVYSMVVPSLFFVIAYGVPALFKDDSFIIHMFIVAFVFVVAACIFSIHYERMIQYSTTMHCLLNLNKSFIDGTFKKEIYKKDVEIRDKDISANELSQGKFHQKKGYAYLNALFFHRHKRLFYKPMKRKIIAIVVIFVIIDVCLLMFQDQIEALSTPYTLLPPMVFVLYAISIGERVTRAMFYNCDVSLLHYGYYRQPEAILANFKYRFQKIVKLNGILATLLCVGFVSLFLCLQEPFAMLDIVLFMVTIYAIAIFFSVHHLCMYYLLQPYTGELEMKSPIFGVVNTIVYVLSYMAMQMDGSIVFTIIVLVATLAYSVIALILVQKKAPETFHIR